MPILRLVRNLSYSPFCRRAARALHLAALARNWYGRLAQPPDGMIALEVAGIKARFRASNVGELRTVENEVLGERRALEFFLSSLQPSDVVYEVGAGAGGVTVFLARAGAKVIAFEPAACNRNRFVENLRLNDVKGVQVFDVALGERDERIPFYSGEGGLYLSARLVSGSSVKGQVEIIRVVNGDAFRESNRLPLPCAVHIDVEGHEYAVIRGLRTTLQHEHCQLVGCEIHPGALPAGIDRDSIVALLKSLGFLELESYVSHSACITLARKRGVSAPAQLP